MEPSPGNRHVKQSRQLTHNRRIMLQDMKYVQVSSWMTGFASTISSSIYMVGRDRKVFLLSVSPNISEEPWNGRLR
jgi:hypothetical protein